MKPTYLIILLLIGVFIGILFMKSCNKPVIPDNSEKLKELQVKINELENENSDFAKKIDSLETLKGKIKTQIVYRDREIDANISKDSANARSEFNRALIDNNELPDKLPDNLNYVSFKDLGLSAKVMSKVPKLELQLNACEEQNHLYSEQVDNDKYIKESYKDVIKIKELEISKYAIALDKSTSFWHNDALWFGLGGAAAVAVVFLTGLAK